MNTGRLFRILTLCKGRMLAIVSFRNRFFSVGKDLAVEKDPDYMDRLFRNPPIMQGKDFDNCSF